MKSAEAANRIESRGNFSIDFGGPHEIDVQTLNAMASSVSEIAELVTSEIAPDAHAKILGRDRWFGHGSQPGQPNLAQQPIFLGTGK